MALKPWYHVVQPRADLREGRPLDASEFAVHLDQVRDGRAPADYQDPQRFFDRTYMTQGLTAMAAEVVRRLSGERTETSAVFNLITQFGGGKTHALALLYHLARNGPAADTWPGVRKILDKAGISSVPQAATAVFIGTEFDSLRGRGGDDGTPLRKTPWGEIAFQLGGAEAFALVAEHDQRMMAPAGDVIRRMLPSSRPCLILMDELMNYVSRNRGIGLSAQLYDFLQNLSETARGEDHVVLAVSIPASELEMNAEDQSDYERFKKLLDRLGKAVLLSAETETSEIIRRRLFEWNTLDLTQEGRYMSPREAVQTCTEYAKWVVEHRQQIPSWFPADSARESFMATYPFHPMVLTVFERKWRTLPRFQQTRGILRLLALWVSRAYQAAYRDVHSDALIGLGTAPLEDPTFRAAAFEQLGENRLEGAVTTDICGKRDSHAVRLDDEAVDTIRKARLHKKVATAIFFESNGGQARAEATVPEIRLSIAEPQLDIANVDTVLETLGATCYFLSVERNRYRFSLSPNLNKILADRRATVPGPKIEERIRTEVQRVFATRDTIIPIFFPESSDNVPNRPVVTLSVLAPEHSMQDRRTLEMVEKMTREYGTSSRTFKSALIWAVADSDTTLREEARKALAWEDIHTEEVELHLDEGQKRQLGESLLKAQSYLKESVWRAYKNIVILGSDNALRVVDLGLLHSSSAGMVSLIFQRLRQDGDVEESISPNFLVRTWPPAFIEWSTKSMRDAFFASPLFPRLLKPDALKLTIAKGVTEGFLAYVGKAAGGGYAPFSYREPLDAVIVEISDEMFIITKETAEAYLQAQAAPAPAPVPALPAQINDGGSHYHPVVDTPAPGRPAAGIIDPPPPPSTRPTTVASHLAWTGEVPAQKWMNFYMKVLTKFATIPGLKLTIKLQVSPPDGISEQKLEETKMALRELGLEDDMEVE